MTTTQVTPTIAINKSQLKDDVVEKLTSQGYTLKEVNSLLHQLEYRKMYNQREDVVAKRRAYNHKRNLKMKAMKSLLSQL